MQAILALVQERLTASGGGGSGSGSGESARELLSHAPHITGRLTEFRMYINSATGALRGLNDEVRASVLRKIEKCHAQLQAMQLRTHAKLGSLF